MRLAREAPSASIRALLRRWGAVAGDLVYPRACMACGAPDPLPGRYVCWECQGKIEYHRVDVFCSWCGRSFEGDLPEKFVCGICRERHPHYDAARSAAHFQGAARVLLHAFKYGKGLWLLHDLAGLLESCARQHFSQYVIEAICPVPLHPRRFRARGYNQSGLLSGELARRMGVPSLPDLLRRRRNTESQTHLNAEQRHRNVDGVFEVKPLLRDWVEERCVLVVDDVMTTGATVSDAARALKEAGAARVLVATVARD